MARLFLITACLAVLMIGSFADKEYEAHGHDHHHHHHAHDGHDHHDLESHKELFGAKVHDGKEQDEKLRIIANKIDTDRDGKVSHDEMRVYVEQRVKALNDREADDLISTLDPKNTNKITFDAYSREYFGNIERSPFNNPDKSNLNLRENKRLYLADKAKWEFVDTDGDLALTYDEFRAFLRPEENEGLAKIEIDSTINEYDEDNDGKISNNEYRTMTEAEAGQADSLTSEIDTNNDGFGDFDEFSAYYLPSIEKTVNEETDHLMKECDTNKDGYCTPDEIASVYTTFAGSQITDFGADLEKTKEEL
ncbi:unnamed protein product [Rotaria magnacalcarata]|nr:unnamed protein product [Rotaria magnacalcarata]CAF1421980.1 unnamed protein product [Rotaria magnacalcarata]CAF2031231.1 unnamed protein product [Rotaria magnacalcarata]CAF2063268.1 unnamed protein product [Rotaria magnacalcarata]CAF2068732.1 unnamed protein product [Rotaria magnacalcarata]